MKLVKGQKGKYAFIANSQNMLYALADWGGADVCKAMFDYSSQCLGLSTTFNKPATLQYMDGNLSRLKLGLNQTNTGLFFVVFHCNEAKDVLWALLSSIMPITSAQEMFNFSAELLGLDTEAFSL